MPPIHRWLVSRRDPFVFEGRKCPNQTARISNQKSEMANRETSTRSGVHVQPTLIKRLGLARSHTAGNSDHRDEDKTRNVRELEAMGT